MLRSSAIVILAAWTGACSSTPAQSTTDNIDPQPAVDAGSVTPLVIRGRGQGGRGQGERGQGERGQGGRGQSDATWLEHPFRDEVDLYLDEKELVALGASTAIIATTMGTFAVDVERGVSGPLTPPAAVSWLGIGGRNDAFYAADKEGVLYRADTPTAATRGFTQVSRVSGAHLWDAAPGIIVAAVADRVHISADGASFSRMRSVGSGLKITELFARHDGVVVVRARDGKGKHKVFVTRDRKRWRLADYQPASLIKRGAWIASADDDCAQVLTSDGVHWIHTGTPRDLPSWTINFELGDSFHLRPPAAHLTATAPPAPPYDADRDANNPHGCRARGVPTIGAIGRLVQPPRKTALDPIRATVYPRPPITRTEIDALSDGLCATGATDECDDQAAPTRMPHALALDRESGHLRVLPLPPHCRPQQVDAIAGLGLLLCKQGAKLEAHTLVGDGFVAEHSLATAAITATGVASDGSIGLASCRDGACKLFVRLPIAVGMGGGWRELTIANAIAFRLLPGGRVLAVVEEQADSAATVFSLVLDRPGSAARTLATSIRVEGFVEALDVDTDNHVFLTVSSGGKPATKWLVGEDGRLLAAD